MSQDTATTRMAVLAALIMAVSAILIAAPVADADDATTEPEYEKDLGEIWSYGYQFEFKGHSANAIRWNFGDGSEEIYDDFKDGVIDNDIWNPAHYYKVPGTYYITLTTYNDYDPDNDGIGSSTTSVYKLTVRGLPSVTFMLNDGTETVYKTVEQPSGESNAVPVEKPTDPTWEGHEFSGWFTDKECTKPYDFSQKVTEPLTLYAGWDIESVPGGDDTPSEGGDDGSETDWLAIGMIVVGIIIAIIALISMTAVGPVGAVGALVGIIVVVAGALKFMGVF